MSKKNRKNTEEILVEESPQEEIPPVEEDQPKSESDTPTEAELSPKELKAALDESQTKATEYLDGWQRARAEFSNYKKRVERERETIKKNAVGEVVKRYLPVLDDLERALKNRPTEGEGAAWAEGLDLVYRKMLSILEADGITPIQAEGEIFDPNLHEAIAQSPSDEHESDQIVEVLQQGYLIDERVLRPAMVRVAA